MMNVEKLFHHYQIFHSMKMHFTSNYDFFRYRGKSYLKMVNFSKKPDKFFVDKILNKWGREYQNFVLANVLESNDASSLWIGSLCDNNAEDVYNSWKGRIEALPYQFRKEITDLKNFMETENVEFNEFFSTNLCIDWVINRKFSPETVIILDHILGLFDTWKENDDFVLQRILRKLIKYRPFLSISLPKYKDIMKEIFLDQ